MRHLGSKQLRLYSGDAQPPPPGLWLLHYEVTGPGRLSGRLAVEVDGTTCRPPADGLGLAAVARAFSLSPPAELDTGPARAAAGAWRLQQGCHWTPANRRGLAPAVWRIPPLHLARPFFHPESTTPRRRCRRRPRRFIVFECRQRFPACVRSRKTRINSLRAHNSFESGRKHVRSRLVDAVTLDGSFSRVMPLLDRENGS